MGTYQRHIIIRQQPRLPRFPPPSRPHAPFLNLLVGPAGFHSIVASTTVGADVGFVGARYGRPGRLPSRRLVLPQRKGRKGRREVCSTRKVHPQPSPATAYLAPSVRRTADRERRSSVALVLAALRVGICLALGPIKQPGRLRPLFYCIRFARRGLVLFLCRAFAERQRERKVVRDVERPPM